MENDARFDLGIFTLQLHGPLISRGLAEKIAIAFIEDRYPSENFRPSGVDRVEDMGESWRVFVKNANVITPAVPAVQALLIPSILSLEISKKDGAILSIGG